MELDKRILKGKRPLSPFDTEEAKKFIGKQCYFTSDIISFAYLGSLNKGELTSVGDDEINPYKHIGERSSYSANFILPCEWVQKQEKKYRPYTIEEFCNEGFESLVFREKNNPLMEYHVRYNGYRKCDNVYKVILGNISYTLSDLFDGFKLLDRDGNWIPFGVEE